MEKSDSYRLHESRSKEQDASLRLQVRRERHMVHDLRCILQVKLGFGQLIRCKGKVSCKVEVIC